MNSPLTLGGSEPNRGVYFNRLRGIFGGRVWWCKPRDSSNLITFAVKNEHLYLQWSRLMSKAQTLDKRYRLDLLWVVNNMRRREELDG